MERLKVGIVGAAGRGASFFTAFTCNPHTHLEALCDLNEDGLRRTAAEVGVARVFTDYDTMLDQAGLDILSWPSSSHTP